jgi:tRNA A37 threonylcarbamoyladenosine dehydratase
MTHFTRTLQLLGPEQFERLRGSTVAVFGLGGVGSYAVENLARAGIGRLRLIDFDVVKPSNINRQLFALHSTVGRSKAEVARERVLDINPVCEIEALGDFAGEENLEELLELRPRANVVVDAIDSLSPKLHLLAESRERALPVVSSMGAAGGLDPSMVRVGDLSETRVCPLARLLRKRLHRRGIYTGIRCVYSTEQPAVGEPIPVVEEETLERGRVRTPLGSISYMPALFGLLAAAEVVRLVTDG